MFLPCGNAVCLRTGQPCRESRKPDTGGRHCESLHPVPPPAVSLLGFLDTQASHLQSFLLLAYAPVETLTGSQPTWLLSHTYRLLIGLREHAQPRHSTFFSDGQGNMLPTTCACSWKHVHVRIHARTLHRCICSPVWRQTDRAPLRRDLCVSDVLGKKIEEAVVRG